MLLIDSHVNLHASAFDEDREAVIARARAAGVGVMLTICDRMENADAVAAIAAAHDDIWMSVGAHPHYAKDHTGLTADALVDFVARHPKVAAIGETGLDLYYRHSPLDAQEQVLRTHITAARRLDLPVIIHTRDADDDMIRVLESETKDHGAFRFLLHCYTSGAELAQRVLALGGYFSLSGILTFKTADSVRAVADTIPLDRIILETDCPYLAPIPHRGRRNEPAYLADLHRFFCAWRGIDEEQGAERLADTFFSLFRTIPRPAGKGAS